MKAEIISIGTEILLGEITNTNAGYLAGQMPLLGLDLCYMLDVGDNRQRLIDSLRLAWHRSDIIITTGGLGPTQDDITRESIADFLGETMILDPDLLATVQQFFTRLNREMSPNNRKQAMLIPSAKSIPNERGTAPGWWVEKDGRVIIVLPGPPHEMQYMWIKYIYPLLQQRLGSSIITSKTIKTFGLGEGNLDHMIEHLIQEKNPSVGVYTKYDGIHLRITAKAETAEEAGKLISRKESELSSMLSQYIWGSNDDTIESVTESLLVAQNSTVAAMEFQTGGFLAHSLTNGDRNKDIFRGGLVIQSVESMESFGIPKSTIQQRGPISCETAAAMASVARNHFGSSIGIGVTAVTDENGLHGASMGTICIGIVNGSRKKEIQTNYSGQRQRIKQRAAIAALMTLKQFLNEEN